MFAREQRPINVAKAQLMQSFKMRDLGSPQNFTVIQIPQTPGKALIHQENYALHILESFDHLKSHPVKVPFDPKVVLCPGLTPAIRKTNADIRKRLAALRG